MQAPYVRNLCSTACSLIILAASIGPSQMHAADQFTKPTQEELSMTSLPGYPGAPAVVLYKEEQTKDDLHVVQYYERLKILTEEGKKYANVELNFASARGGYIDESDDMMMGDIAGRTIHPDGSIVPFTGKPYLKVIEKSQDVKFQQKVFTLPDVTVGSIIEYRYSRRFSDSFYEAPEWYIQGDLFVRSAHYSWYPTRHPMVDSEGQIINAISWFAPLPPGVQIKTTEIPRSSNFNEGTTIYEVTVKDVPPIVKEDHMPPVLNFSYRVLFNYTAYRSADDYWKATGKRWSKTTDAFIGSNSGLSKAAATMIEGASSDDEKLKKIYTTVMGFENTDLTRERSKREGKVSNALDVLAQKRGSSTQLADLFVGLARGAGFKAYAMLVTDRSESIFVSTWLSMRQFNDEIAIVNVGGRDKFFDPGERYCAFGQLAWQHTLVRGLRQTDGGTDFATTPTENYAVNKTTRVANLTMDEAGAVNGKIDLTYYGAPALYWRQRALKGDVESVNHALENELEKLVPGSLDVKISKIQNLDDYEKPLVVNYQGKGTIGTATGKRVVLPVDLFASGETATFTHEKRELPVYFHFPESTIDALRINLPHNFSVEAVPDVTKTKWNEAGLFSLSVETMPSSVTVRRTFIMNEVVLPAKEYAELRGFYSQMESKDKESVVLKTSPVQAELAVPAAKK